MCLKVSGAGCDNMFDTAVAEKIIKTADMKLRVKDVQSTKEKLGRCF